MNRRISRIGLAFALGGVAGAVSAQAAPTTDLLAIRTVNICLAAASGADVRSLTAAQGYHEAEGTYARQIGDRWTFFRAFPVETGRPDIPGYGCRMTVMRPHPIKGDSSGFMSRGPMFQNQDFVMDRLTSGPASFGNPFSVYALRERRPDRPGHKRTELQRLTGNTVEIIYIEEGIYTVEMFYARGPRGAIGRQEMIDAATDPATNMAVHADISWMAREEWCARKGGCAPLYADRNRGTAYTAPSAADGVYLHGYKPGARALSSLEQDYYAGKGYTIRRDRPTGF